MTIEDAVTPTSAVDGPSAGWTSIPRDIEEKQGSSTDIVMGGQREMSRSLQQEMSDLEKAFELSMRDIAGPPSGGLSGDSPNPHYRTREDDMPVGMKNVGNSCYVTSIVQSYFAVKQFRELVLSLEFPEEMPKDDIRCVVKELQRLFGFLTLSQRKYVDPTDFLLTLRDSEGNCVHTGAQQDPTEFRIFFLEKVQESIDAIRKSSGVEQPMEGGEGEGEVFDLEEEPAQESSQPQETSLKEVEEIVSGRFLQIIRGVEQDGTPFESKQEPEFTEISLNLTHCENLYQSLDLFVENVDIEDFQSPGGHKCVGHRSISLQDLPPVLSFQLQRVDFDTKRQTVVKNHSRLEFPLTLYPDRYLASHSSRFEELKRQQVDLQMELAEYQDRLAAYDAYGDSKQPIKHLLHASLAYLRDKNEEELRPQMDVLAQAFDRVCSEEASLRARIEENEAKLATLFDEFNHTAYHLHSVLVHGGQGGGGHYYSFLYDPQRKVWYKFNDKYVTIEEEADVFREAYGGKGTNSAYCILYARNDCPSGLPTPTDCNLIMPALQLEIADDNEAHEQEKTEWDETQARREREEMERRAAREVQALSDSFSQLQSGGSSVSSQRVREYEHQLELRKMEMENTLHTIFGLDLVHFAKFLYTSGRLMYYELEMANIVMRDYLGFSLLEPEAQEIPLARRLIQNFRREEYQQYDQEYRQITHAWRCCYSGLCVLTQSVYEATLHFYGAYERSRDYPGLVESCDRFLQFFEKGLRVLSLQAKRHWQEDSLARTQILTVGVLALRLPPHHDTAFNLFCNDWRGVVDHFQRETFAAFPHPDHLQRFVRGLANILEGKNAFPFNLPHPNVGEINPHMWYSLPLMIQEAEECFSRLLS